MEIVCENCSRKMNLPDDKLPEGRAFYVTCQQCQNKITVSPEPSKEDFKADIPKTESVISESDGVLVDSRFEFELSMAYDKTALVCDNHNQALIKERLERLEYGVHISQNVEDATNQIRFTMYDVIVLHESFGGNPESNAVLKYIQPLPMSTRRKVFVTLICDRIRTLDNLEALAHSVNLIINSQDLAKFDIIFKKQLQDNDFFYKIYRETLKNITGYW